MEPVDVPYGAMPGWLPDREPVGHESPYPDQTGCRVVLKRSAMGWLPEIEAHLAEQEMPVSLAESVAKVMDVSGWSCAETVRRFRELLDAH